MNEGATYFYLNKVFFNIIGTMQNQTFVV